MTPELFDLLDREGVERCVFWRDESCGLRAVLVIDSTTLGPAAGGVRTRSYDSVAAAVGDAAALARAMTIKCALGGLAAGGAKAVVMDHPGLDRPRAFERLGELISELGGLFRTAGDLGTTAADLQAMARRCQYVHTDEGNLAASVARGLVACVSACAARRGHELSELAVAVQGAGSIGAAVARAVSAAGCSVIIADLDHGRAEAVADEIGAVVVDAADIFTEPADVVAPCAIGGVIDAEVARSLEAWAVCGAANNILAADDVAELLRERDVLLVPDVIASAGAVIDGIGASVMGLADRAPLINALGSTAARVLEESARSARSTVVVARELAAARIAAAG
jgi:leucine dehydrogenase